MFSGLDIPAGVGRGPTPPPGVSQPTPTVKSPSPTKSALNQSPMKPTPAAAPRVKSPESAPRKSVTSLGSFGEPSAAVRSPSPPAKPLPEIQITRTESNRSNINEKWVKPEKMEEDKGESLKFYRFQVRMKIY